MGGVNYMARPEYLDETFWKNVHNGLQKYNRDYESVKQRREMLLRAESEREQAGISVRTVLRMDE